MRSAVPRPSSFASKNAFGNRSALIVGAGVAGPVLAYFLHRYGVRPVVVERAPQLRTSGQTIDVRGAGKEVLRRMGVDSAIREKLTGEQGVAVVDSAGRTVGAFGVDNFGGRGFVSEIEILRGELVNVLYEQTRHDIEYVFGDHPLSISNQSDHVQVKFASGKTREFDLVIGADGLRSKTRRLVFSETSPIKYLNMCNAYFTIPYSPSDGRWARWYNAPGGRTVLLRPDNHDTTRVLLLFRDTDRGYDDLTPDMQKDVLRKVFADAGFETPRVLSAMANANDFYFETVGQVKMNKWSQGRVVLLGDAGYCAAPASGMGTTLAFVGAYILAGEIGRHQDHTEAFRQYELLMRPYVTDAQRIPTIAVRLVLPLTRTGIAVRNAVVRFIARPTILGLINKLNITTTPEKLSLPDYESTPIQ